MKKFELLIIFLLVFLLPNLLFSLWNENSAILDTVPETMATESTAPQVTQPLLRIKDQDTILQMELDTYVLGVLLGEVPADFELEALKAQAVATRTYSLRKLEKQNKHDDADLCTDATCCQAYVAETDYLLKRGTETDLAKMREAVSSTAGQVLTYQDKLIEATYFSCSGGKTEDAVDVWGASVPYLQSVVSPGEEEAQYYVQEFTFTQNTFRSKLGLPGEAVLTQDSVSVSYTEGGGVDKLSIAGRTFGGVQIRTLLSLPSTAFTLSVSDDSVLVTVKGNGHRVGMSQYGADAMAVAGKKYDEILAHYYSGTSLEYFDSNESGSI